MAMKRILIVEDEGIAAMALEMELAALGYETISTVASGEAAVEQAIQLEPDLIFMDIYLDGKMTGIEAVRQIHAQKKIPVVFTTASQNPKIAEEVNTTEHAGFVQKPYLTIEIAKLLTSVFPSG